MSLTIVTGAGSGMGRDIALSLVAAGQPVLAVGRRRERLEQTASLSADAALVSVATGDLSRAADVEAIVGSIGDQAVRAIVTTAGGQGDFRKPGNSVAAIEGAGATATDHHAVDPYGGLADTHIDPLPRLAAGRFPGVEGEIGSDHVNVAKRLVACADQRRAINRRGEPAILDQMRFGGTEVETTGGDIHPPLDSTASMPRFTEEI